jgi:hypothetical protein
MPTILTPSKLLTIKRITLEENTDVKEIPAPPIVTLRDVRFFSTPRLLGAKPGGEAWPFPY